jgi:protein-disulfide isomerase
MRGVLYLAVLAVLVLPAGCALAQEKKAGSGPDPATVERFLRRQFNWPDEVQVTVGPYRPSPIPGLLQTTVQVIAQGKKHEAQYLITPDGQYLLLGPAFVLSSDPLAAVRAKMNLAESPSLGSPLAPVAIVEFSDLQCSFCKGMAGVLRDEIMTQYSNRARLVFKNFPLPQIHPWAMPAALLGRCIYKRYGDDGFWNYEKWIFGNQAAITAESFKDKTAAYAKENKLDGAQLAACMERQETKDAVERDVSEGASLQVNATPTLFINGRRMVGNQGAALLKQTIDGELAQLQGKK